MPGTESISAQIKGLAADAPEDHPAHDRVGQEFEVTKELPGNIQEATEMYGEEVVFSRFRGALVIDLQSFMRTQIKKKDFTEDTLQAAVDAWSPGTRGPGVSMATKAENLMASMSEDDLKALLASVTERRAAG
jgi:hypothetical protein